MSVSFRLDGKIAFVTGASQGIGAGIADALRDSGATVIGTSRNVESAVRLAHRFSTAPVTMDVRDVASIRTGVDAVVAAHGSLRWPVGIAENEE